MQGSYSMTQTPHFLLGESAQEFSDTPVKVGLSYLRGLSSHYLRLPVPDSVLDSRLPFRYFLEPFEIKQVWGCS